MRSFLVAFACLFVLDFVWVFYTRAVVNGSKFIAASLAGFMQFLIAIATIVYIADPWAVGGLALGAFLGTIAAMMVDK